MEQLDREEKNDRWNSRQQAVGFKCCKETKQRKTEKYLCDLITKFL